MELEEEKEGDQHLQTQPTIMQNVKQQQLITGEQLTGPAHVTKLNTILSNIVGGLRKII